MCKFHDIPFRDVRDPLSRNLGPKPANQPIKKVRHKNILVAGQISAEWLITSSENLNL